MAVILGIVTLAGLCLTTLMAGYTVAGFMTAEGKLTRLAVASLIGIAWLVLGASVLGAVAPLNGAPLALLWCPSVFVWLIPGTRRQLVKDVRTAIVSPAFLGACVGLVLLLLCLLLPYVVYPGVVFYDGKTNHDNFFWCVGAEYLQQHTYLTLPVPSRDHPLFQSVHALIGWKPIWGRMGAEGFLAIASSTVGRSPVEIYNFAVCSLVPAWILSVIAVAKQLGLAPLVRGTHLFLSTSPGFFHFQWQSSQSAWDII